jgi:uncharacterized repeat protein (TIGR03806 family)
VSVVRCQRFARRYRVRTALFALACVTCVACADSGGPDEDTAPASLEELGLFDDVVAQTPAPGVVPYDVNAVLFADDSYKLRFMKVPGGQAATYDEDGPWDFPVGTQLVKTFYFPTDERELDGPRRLLETRILERTNDDTNDTDEDWTVHTYVWNEEQTEALRVKAGKRLHVSWTDELGTARELEYRVPNDNECATCHAKDHAIEPLGPQTRQLHRDYEYGTAEMSDVANQIDRLVELGALSGDVPDAAERFALSDPYGDEDLDTRARSYLDANCAHCHRPGGEAGSTGLDLRITNMDPYSLGVCKGPVAAGPGSGQRAHDVVPGDPDKSILVFRMESTDPSIKMPELPTITSDEDGVRLIREWVAAMPGDGCP